jgi:general secretion pathway protein F
MITAAMGALLLIFTTVIPENESIFTEAEQTLPLLTRVMLALSKFIVAYWWVVLSLVIVTIIAINRFLKSKYGSRKWDSTQLKLPLFGPLIRMVAISRFTKTLSTLLRSGIPLLTSLKVVKPVVNNYTIMKAIEQASTELTEGQNIADPLKKSGEFPPLVTHMISVGEKTGELENMLERVSDHYEYQVNNKVDNFTALLEPVMILLLAIIVGVIILSVIQPMLNLNEAVF